MPKKKRSAKATDLICFRITQDLSRVLATYGRSQTDDSGQALSPAMAARRIVVETLKKLEQGTEDKK